jgi:hypothetical protein
MGIKDPKTGLFISRRKEGKESDYRRENGFVAWFRQREWNMYRVFMVARTFSTD